MDYSSEDTLESNWVFVEEVDIAEEALDLNNTQKDNEANNSSQDSCENVSKCLTKSSSDSQLVTPNDNLFKSLNKPPVDHDSESDGISIISNWSYYSQETPPEEISDEGTDDIENDGKHILDIKYSDYIQDLQNGEDQEIQKQDEEIQKHDEEKRRNEDEEKQRNEDEEKRRNEDEEKQINEDEEKQRNEDEEKQRTEDEEKQRNEDENIDTCAADELQSIMDEEDVGNEILEDIKDDLYNDLEGVEKDGDESFTDSEEEDSSDSSGRSSPLSHEQKMIQFDTKLLRWLDEATERMEEDEEKDHPVQDLVFRIAEIIQKNVSVSGFLIGTVLLAASSFFLGSYYTATKTIQDDLPTYQENGFLYDVPNDENFDVETALHYCRAKHRSDDIYMEINTHKCLRKIERMKCKKHNKLIQEGIQTWEQYLEAKEKFLIEKERKLSRQEALVRYKHKKYDRNDGILKKIQDIQCNLHNNVNTYRKADSNGKNYRRENKHLQQNQKQKDDSKEKKNKGRGDAKQYPVANQNLKHQNKEKHNRDTSKERMCQMGWNSGKKCKKTGKTNEKFNTILKTEENQKNYEYFVEEKFAKQDKGKNTNHFSKVNSDSCQKNKKECKRARNNKYQQNYETNLLKNDGNNETVDGDWLSKLFRGRSDLRSRENNGEWYFDRSSYRKRKRDKAKWYFDWMMDREILRYRRLYLNL